MVDQRQAESSSGSTWHPFVEWGRGHALALWAVALFALLVAKVLVVSRGNPETALTLARNASSLDVLVQIAMTVVPIWLPLVFVYLLWYSVATNRVGRAAVPLGFIAALSLVVSPWWAVAFATFLLAVQYGIHRILARNAARKGEAFRFDWDVQLLTSMATLAVAGLYFVITPFVWLPPERVTLANGDEDTYYVVSTDGGWTTLLREEGRSVSIVPSAEIVSRQVCSLGSLTDTLPRRFGNVEVLETPPCEGEPDGEVTTPDATPESSNELSVARDE